MLYQAHFSFEEEGKEKKHGYITALAEAPYIDAAMDKFKSLLEASRKSGHIPKHITRIYLDLAIQIKKVPEKGCITHVLTRPGTLEDAVSSSLPGVGIDYIEAFSLTPERIEGKGVELEPFLVFDDHRAK